MDGRAGVRKIALGENKKVKESGILNLETALLHL